MERRLTAILVADVVGYSRLMESDEEGTLVSLRGLREAILDPSIAAHRGRVVKLMGDGVLAEFSSVVEATLCAIAIQEGVQRHEAGRPSDQRITFRIGVNLGDVIVEDGDIYGDGVNLASRLEGLARPGGICLSAKVYDEIHGKIDAPFRDIGEKEVKNLSYPVHVFELLVSPEGGDPSSEVSGRMASPVMRLNMLGGFEARGRGDEVITIPGRKTEMLLAVLARAGKRGMPREKLLGLLWSDRGNDQARSSLRQTVWSLRRTFEQMEPSPLRTEGDLLALDSNSVETDVQVFEQLADETTPEALEEAAALYNGEFLDGLVVRDSAGEEWLFYERERLNGVARGVFLRFLEHLIRSGQGSRAIETGQRLLGFDPMNEEAHRALMRLYMAQGQRALALQQFETCSRVLRHELGVRPEAETEALKAEIEGSRQPLHASAGEIRLSAEPDRPVAQPPLKGVAQPRGERKQATVLSADLIETATDDEEAELEESADWQLNAMAAMSASVERYGGIVKTTPDGGLLALFGAPIAFEDHAVRSCLAALDMGRDLDAIVAGEGKHSSDKFVLRIGINSGEVVIRPGPEGAFGGFDTFGPTVPLASRIKDLSTPGAVALSAQTAQQTAGAIETANAREVVLPGLTKPVVIHDLTAAPDPGSRFGAAVRRGLSPFVGRNEDSYFLRKAAQRVAGGQGRAVALAGEPGVGKSRLVHEFVNAIEEGEWRLLEANATAFGRATPFAPVLEITRTILGLSLSDPKSEATRKLREEVILLDPELEQLVAPLSAMLDLPVEDYFWREMTVEEKYEQMLDAAVALLQRFSLEKRTVLVMEDLHWIDSGTKGFIEKLLDGIAGVPVLVLMNFRPEFEHGWGGRSVFSQINLDPLGDEDAGDLASALLGADESVAALKVALVERTKGLPFFLEETVRTLFESGLLQGKTGAYRLAGSTTEKAVATIPPNVQSVLAARIDRLPAEEKHLLQSASVIGKDFSLALLASANDQEEADLQAALAHLQATEFIYEVRKLPNSVFTFKQALTQDVAYNSLLKNERRPLHAAVAASLKENFPERCADNPEMLAHHLTEGGNAPEAVEAWLEAGNKASRRAANREALQHYNKGLEVLEDLPESPERNTNEIAIRVALGVPMGYLEGAETQAFEDNYLRARELCEATGEKRDLFPVLWGLFMSAMMQAKIDRMCQLADNILDVAEDGDDESLLLEAHHCQWAARFLVGDLAQAAAHCRIGQKLYRRDEHHVLTFIYGGHDPLGCAYNISAQALSLSGFPDQALAECDRSVALARELDHPGTLAEALYCAMLIGTILHDVSWIEGRAEALEAFAEGSAVSYYHLMTKGAKGWTIYQKGQRHEGLALMRETVPMWLESGVTWTAPFVTLLAEALVQEEFVSEALDVITKAMGMADRDGVRWYEAELHRVKGVILRHDAGGDAEAAETSIHRALELAREQGAKLLELRAAISLAALWQTQNRSAEARALLEPAYGWFTEGRDSRDLRQAKRLLESLA